MHTYAHLTKFVSTYNIYGIYITPQWLHYYKFGAIINIACDLSISRI